MNLPPETDWIVRNKDVVYEGRVHITDYDVELPDGTSSRYEVEDSIPFAAAVLLVDSHVHLARQYRFPLREWIYDLPGGAGETGETPPEAVRRECEEEVGVVLGHLVELGSFAPNPGRTSWRTHLFLCDDFAWTGSRQSSAEEDVRLRRVSVSDALDALRLGEYVDPGVNIALGRAHIRGLLTRESAQ